MKSLYLIDSFALAFRIFYAFSRNPLINGQGQDTSLVHGYWSNVLRILALRKPTHMAIVRDMGRQTFRHQLYPDYKANRGDMPEEMKNQLPMLESMMVASGIPMLGEVGFEADDLMASLARRAEAEGFDVFLVTKDKDMAQVVSDRVKLFHLEKGNEVGLMGPAQVEEKFGVPPERMRDYLALVGDSSDNVPGVPKVGPKTAVELLKTYGDLDGIYSNLESISKKGLYDNLANNREKAYLSRELVTLQSSNEFGIVLGDLVFRGLNREPMKRLCQEYELKALMRQVDTVPDRNQSSQASLFAEDIKIDLPMESICVQSSQAFSDLIQRIQALPNTTPIALDTETDSLIGWQANLVGICLAWKESQGYYIPVAHSTDGNASVEQVRELLQILAQPDRQLVLHNAKYDYQVIERFGIKLQGTLIDSMIASWVLDPGQNAYGLDAQVLKRLHHTMIPIESLIGRGKSQILFSQVPIDTAAPYGAEDAVYTLRLWNALEPELKERGLLQVLNDYEMPLIPVLARMEQEGIAIDSEELGRIQVELDERLHKLEEQIYFDAGGNPFNINSPKQLGAVLFDDLGLPAIKKTSTGYSTDASVLEELKDIHPIIAHVIEYRELGKLLNTYVDVLPTLVNPVTHRVHTQFVQTGTATGRLSSRDPNLQNIPIRSAEGKRVRAAFVASEPNTVLLSADYSQIELRMLAHLSGDRNLMEAYQEGQDIHARTAAAIFHTTLDQVTQDMRRQAKVVNFGVLYGMTAFRLARDMGIPRSEAKAFIDGYFSLYGQVKDWVDSTVQEARATGYVETITGRRRYIPGIGSSDGTERQMAERMAVNSPVQGSAADLIKLAMVSIDQKIQQEQQPLRLLLQVHDELVFECPAQEADSASKWIKSAMENVLTLKVPLVVEVGQGRNWLKAH